MTNMPLDNLLSNLGYSEKSGVKYYPFEAFSSLQSLSPLSRIVSRINEDNQNAQIHGTYVINPDYTDEELDINLQIDESLVNFQPVVFVAKAETPEEAREIHHSLWNTSFAPFIIVSLPDQIRVYTGFDYDPNNPNQGLLDEVDLTQTGLFADFSKVTMEALEKYNADSIDDGSIWQKLRNAPQDKFNYDNRVDKRLLKNLEDLEQVLIEKLSNFEKEDALKYIHAIIGKYIYFQYLYDREILTENWAKKRNIDLDKVLNRGATLSELIKLNDAIEFRFEGKIFPFPKDFKEVINSEIVDFVASVFYGDTAYGERVLFGIYDFSYIPIETLSYIYEQFLKAQGLSKKHGAVYTPEALADYLVNEINTVKPLKRGMKILDPCCGSGIFLVLTYRYLIELELQKRQQRNLTPDELKQIMNESIHGVELNLEACYVTEFSLILILLNYIEPPDLDRYDDFKFPNLHDKNIFEGDFFNPNKEFYPLTMSFDWVIGNPPWKAINIKKNKEDKNALEWIQSNSETRPVSDKRIETAFAWRATEFVAEDGCIGFVLPATQMLFNNKNTSKIFRQEFFRQNEVRRITNFSNFHYLLFQADVSAITVIYKKFVFGSEKKPIWHYSPFVANQILAQLGEGKVSRPVWTIIINKNEIKIISSKQAETGNSLVWKMAMWGSYEDERAFTRLRNTISQTFNAIRRSKRWNLHKGLELRHEEQNNEDDPIEEIDKWVFEKYGNDLKILNSKMLNESNFHFSIPSRALVPIPNQMRFVRQRRKIGYNLIPSPHLILNSQYAIYSDKDFAVGSQYAVAVPDDDANLLKAISIYFSSSVCRYLLFFMNPQWGISRTTLSKKDWEMLPVPSFSEHQVDLLAQLQTDLVTKEQQGEEVKILQEILDSKIEEILEIPESIKLLVHDFFNVKLSLNKGKTSNVKAVKKPQKMDLENYAERLRYELDEFVQDGNERHLITLIYSDELIVCQVNLLQTKETQNFRIEKAVDDWKDVLADIKKGLEERFSQWVYIQRELRFFNTKDTFYICKSPRLIDWTQSQAISDANDLIGKTLANIDLNSDRFAQTSKYENAIADQPR